MGYILGLFTLTKLKLPGDASRVVPCIGTYLLESASRVCKRLDLDLCLSISCWSRKLLMKPESKQMLPVVIVYSAVNVTSFGERP